MPQRLQLLDNLLVLGKPMLRVLRKNRSAIDDDVERAAVARRERRFEGQLAGNRGRQTGSLGTVVSPDAVSNDDAHPVIITATSAAGHRSTASPTGIK
jgi:hypothetical protein